MQNHIFPLFPVLSTQIQMVQSLLGIVGALLDESSLFHSSEANICSCVPRIASRLLARFLTATFVKEVHILLNWHPGESLQISRPQNTEMPLHIGIKHEGSF